MPRIRVYGQRSKLGFGVFYSELLDSLKRLAVFGMIVEAVDLTVEEEVRVAIGSSSQEDINIWFWLNSSIPSTKGIHIVWSLFESDLLDEDYIKNYLLLAHVIWTPSSWGKEVLINHGIPKDKVDVVPGGVNPSVFHPLLRTRDNPPDSTFRFLTIGKYEQRKGYEPLLASFLRAFSNDKSVILDIKADFFLNHAERKSELELLVKRMGLQNVNLVWGKLDDIGMFSLYNRASSFVYPSRAEGWGLPLIEAIAMGIPTISTFYSGHSEFLTAIEGLFYKVRHISIPIDDDLFFSFWPKLKPLRPSWADPNEDDLVAHMLNVRENYPIAQEGAIKASSIIRREFSWQNSADTAIHHIMQRGFLSTGYR
jgi:glycosyltransferase involved in cell wall biosynthesis